MDEELSYQNNGSTAFYAEEWEDIAPRSIKGLMNLGLSEGMPCRIGICGAQGVGKTLLAKRIGEELDIPIVEQVARTVKNLGFPINKKSTVNAQLAIWLGQLHEQLTFYNFISDRTLIDHYAHLMWIAQHKDIGLDKYIVRALGNITSGVVCEQYSVIFYIPPREIVKPNGYRSTDRKYQREIDKLLLTFLNSFEVEYFPLVGNDNQKYELAMNYISESGMLDSLNEEGWEDD